MIGDRGAPIGLDMVGWISKGSFKIKIVYDCLKIWNAKIHVLLSNYHRWSLYLVIFGYWMLLGFLAQHVAMSRTLETNPYGASLPHVFFGDLAHYSEGCLTSGGASTRDGGSSRIKRKGVAPSKHRSILNIVRMGMGWMLQLDRECLYIKRPWGFGMWIKQPKVITAVDVPDDDLHGPSVWFPPQRSNRMFHDGSMMFYAALFISWRKVARPHCQRQQRGFSHHWGPIGHNKQRLKQASGTRISLGILADEYHHD